MPLVTGTSCSIQDACLELEAQELRGNWLKVASIANGIARRPGPWERIALRTWVAPQRTIGFGPTGVRSVALPPLTPSAASSKNRHQRFFVYRQGRLVAQTLAFVRPRTVPHVYHRYQ